MEQEACAIPWLSVHRDRKSAKEESGSREGEGKEPSESLSLLLLCPSMPGEDTDTGEVILGGPDAEENPQSLPGLVFFQESRRSLQTIWCCAHTLTPCTSTLQYPGLGCCLAAAVWVFTL